MLDKPIKEWYINGRWHREDGPAIIWKSGDRSWYLNNKKYTKEKYLQELEKLRGKEHTNKIRLIYAQSNG